MQALGGTSMDLKIDSIEIKVVAWDPTTARPVAEDWLDVPATIGPNDVEAYLVGRLGPRRDEPVELVHARPAGWHFDPASLADVGLPSGDLQLLAVPFVRFPDGRRLELAEYHAVIGRHFRDLVASIDPHVGPLGSAPSERCGRLEEEHLAVATTIESDVELQVGGWLHRLIRDGRTYLVIDLPVSGRYVQFVTQDGDWLRAEAVGDRYLGGHPPLSAAERDGLVELGWNAPDEDDDDGGNYWLEWGLDDESIDLDAARHPVSWTDPDSADLLPDTSIADASRLAATTLCRVFGPLELSDLVAQAGPVRFD